MILAIIVLLLATMSISLFVFQVINQIKFTKRTEDSMVSKYEVDAGIEMAVLELLKKIVVTTEKTNYKDVNNKNYFIKDVKVSYLNEIKIDSPVCLNSRNYNILVQNKPTENKISKSNNGSTSDIIGSNGVVDITLPQNDNQLDELKITYIIYVESKLKNTKNRKYEVNITLKNIETESSYGIGYEINEIKG